MSVNIATVMKPKKIESTSSKAARLGEGAKITPAKRGRFSGVSSVVIASKGKSQAAIQSVMNKHGREIIKAWTKS